MISAMKVCILLIIRENWPVFFVLCATAGSVITLAYKECATFQEPRLYLAAHFN